MRRNTPVNPFYIAIRDPRWWGRRERGGGEDKIALTVYILHAKGPLRESPLKGVYGRQRPADE